MQVIDLGSGVIRRRIFWPIALCSVGVFIVPALALNQISLSAVFAVWFVLTTGCACACLAIKSTRHGRISAGGGGVCLDGIAITSRHAIRAATVHGESNHSVVRLHRHWLPTIDVAFQQREQADSLVSAMKLTATESVGRHAVFATSYAQHVRRLGVICLCVAGPAIAMMQWPPPALPLFLLGELLLLVAGGCAIARLFATIEIGQEGIVIQLWLSAPRLIPAARIDSVQVTNADVRVLLRDGTALTLNTGPGRRGSWAMGADQEDEAHAISRRILDAVAACRTRSLEASIARRYLLSRGGRAPHRWLEEVRHRRDSFSNHRQAAVPAEELWSVLEDPYASPSERAGAAIALRDEVDGATRDRVRVAAEACVAPDLRAALVALASPDADERHVVDALAFLKDADEATASIDVAPSPDSRSRACRG